MEGLLVNIPLHQTMASVFESTVTQYPDSTAVIFEEKHLTYSELDRKANQVAHLIRSTINVTPESVIALCMERSDVMVIGILGVWKAGCAYVPLDPNYPSERINFILEDTKSKLVLVDELNLKHVQPHSVDLKILDISQVESSGDFSKPTSIGTTSDDISHILYTSGTTGKPKGVIVIHKALLNEIIDYRTRYGLEIGPKSGEVIMHILNYVFNAATVPLILALSNGYTLLIVRPAMLFETQKLYEYLAAHKVTHIDCTPSLLARLNLSRLPSLRRVAPGGESLTAEIYNHCMSLSPNLSCYNIYANSEATLCAMYTEMKPNCFTKALCTVATNKKCFILTESTDLADIGELGELGITGTGLAKGYLNNEMLTAEKFIPNPFQTEAEKKEGRNGILYKSGDLVRIVAEGKVEFVGRKDFQVKIRGYRIELEEIEAVIRSFPGISSSVVAPINHENSEEIVLIGYYVKNRDESEDCNHELFKHVRSYLPDYMVPAKLIKLEKMPLTANGKIDRNNLPKPIMDTVSSAKTNGIEENDQNQNQDKGLKYLSKVWKEILNLPDDEHHGTNYDFFDVGGNSLLAMRMTERINDELGISIDAFFVFNHSTIAEFKQNLPYTF